jgi:hypothetical protein
MPILGFPSTKRKEVIQCLSPSAVTSLGSPARLLSLASGRPSPGPASYEGWDATGAIPSRLFVLGAAIPRCAIAHRRFALTRALSDKRCAPARGMTKAGRTATRRANQRAAQTDRLAVVQYLAQKYFCFAETQISPIFPTVPSHQKGRLMIVANAGRDAVDADGASDEGA